MPTTQSLYNNYVLPTYGRNAIAFASGEGRTLYDEEGRAYLDFASGIGVNSVGYAHPVWVKAVADAAANLAHVSNLYHTRPGGLLAQKLCENTGLAKVFFANSGAEANEGIIKLARKYAADTGHPERNVILTLNGSFHGRTHTTLAATGQEKFHAHFAPLTPGFRHVDAGDIAALTGDDVCAVLLEPIQGEGGVIPLDAGYLHDVQAICRKNDWLFMLDEVQTGVGRCGDTVGAASCRPQSSKGASVSNERQNAATMDAGRAPTSNPPLFAFQSLNLQPDAVSFAKGIAGGLPFGGFLVAERAEGVLTPGLHATTFGGSPLCASAALATLDILQDVIPTVAAKGKLFCDLLRDANLPCIREIRGRGLMIGVVLCAPAPHTMQSPLPTGGDGRSDGRNPSAASCRPARAHICTPPEICQKLLEEGLVCLTAGADALRFLPPLTVTESELREAAGIVIATLKKQA